MEHKWYSAKLVLILSLGIENLNLEIRHLNKLIFKI